MKQTNTPTESREDWEKRFDKEFTCIVTYEKWPDEEEQRLREPQYKFKDFPNTNPKIIKNFLHSELEKVRQETIEEMIKLSDEIELQGNTTYEEWRAFKGFRNTMRDRLEALSINKKEQ